MARYKKNLPASSYRTDLCIRKCRISNKPQSLPCRVKQCNAV